MIQFNTIFQLYKENFIKYFPYEKYKWIAVKQFQSKWNLEAANFTDHKDTGLLRRQYHALAEVKHRNDKYISCHKLSNITSPIDYADIKANPELKDMEFLVSPNGILFKLTDEEFDVTMDMISESNDSNLKKETPLPYNEKDFLNEVFMSENDLHTLEYLLKNKKNIILQGASGVGKTFSARRLAYKMMGQKDDRRI